MSTNDEVVNGRNATMETETSAVMGKNTLRNNQSMQVSGINSYGIPSLKRVCHDNVYHVNEVPSLLTLCKIVKKSSLQLVSDANKFPTAVELTRSDVDLEYGNNISINVESSLLVVTGSNIKAVPKLTELSKCVVYSMRIVQPLKALCILSLSHHKIPINMGVYQTTRAVGDHTYDHNVILRKKNTDLHSTHEKTENTDTLIHILDVMEKSDITTNNETDVVIDSMAADIPICDQDINSSEDTLNLNVQEEVIMPNMTSQEKDFSNYPDSESSNADNLSLDSSYNSTMLPKYDSSGTQLILPLKKRKPILKSPES